MSLQLSSPGSGPDWRGKGDASAAVPQASAEDTTPCGDKQALAPAPSPLSLSFLFVFRPRAGWLFSRETRHRLTARKKGGAMLAPPLKIVTGSSKFRGEP
ncbi:MAG: hypothetical protein LKH33_08290 [Acetobacter sp.]|nr:hypothetical protein [Acetobacter sp.]MCI1485792.1 hypothetical protein [Acetobacter sp.]MCI1529828.1 hypothetical protein [Acetobacter sp.]MCI1587505.1 hypothetical protein [Acetobacter sp.]MCI1601721.1 hypothetical protein [Acetobacter sp.]